MEGEKEALSDALMERTRKSYIRSYNRLRGEINALYAEIMDRGAETITRSELYQLTHYMALRDLIASEVKGLAVDDSTNLEKLLNKVTLETLQSNYEEFGLTFNILAEIQAKSIASIDWSGASFSSRIWGNAESFNSRVMNDIESLVIGGKSPSQLKKQLMKDYSIHYREADRLIRTEASHAYNSAAVQSYKDAGCSKVEYLAEADCCELCDPYAGKKYTIGTEPTIPVHPNCRCTYLPVIDGIDVL